jgi:rare lipoprotein A
MQHMIPSFAAPDGAHGSDRTKARAHGSGLVTGCAALLVASATGQAPAFTDGLPAWSEQGRVSWYGPGFHGRTTANGEVFDKNALTMAHRSLAFGSEVRVTNLANGRSVIVRVNDRGPYVRGRIADLSRAAAQELGFVDDGVVAARIELL